MTKLAVLFASVALSFGALSLGARPADACSPAYTCAQQFCQPADALVEGWLRSVTEREGGQDVTIEIVSTHGDAAELLAGTVVTFTAPSYTIYATPGTSILAYAERDAANGALRLSGHVQLGGYDTEGCFGAGATAADVASVVLSEQCTATLDYPVGGRPVARACVAPTPFGCSATTSGGALGALGVVLAGLAFARGRRRRG